MQNDFFLVGKGRLKGIQGNEMTLAELSVGMFAPFLRQKQTWYFLLHAKWKQRTETGRKVVHEMQPAVPVKCVQWHLGNSSGYKLEWTFQEDLEMSCKIPSGTVKQPS